MNRVKGFVQPELNEGQTSLLALFELEHESEYEPERLDKITIVSDDELLIYTSRFIELETNVLGTMPHRHIQIMTVYRMYDSDDPYCDRDSRAYREVMLTNAYRTFEGDDGWYTGTYRDGKPVLEPDDSALHIDWL